MHVPLQRELHHVREHALRPVHHRGDVLRAAHVELPAREKRPNLRVVPAQEAKEE